jgi:hypothetical protein
MLPPGVDTLAPYGKGKGLVHLRDRRRRVNLLAFPSGRSSARGLPGTRYASREGEGSWRLKLRGKPGTRYRIQASLETLREPFDPDRVVVDGKALPPWAWSYDAAAGVLRVRIAVAGRTGVAKVLDR